MFSQSSKGYVMISKRKKAITKKGDNTVSRNYNSLILEGSPGKSKERLHAEAALSPMNASTNTARKFAEAAFMELDLTESVNVMTEKVNKVNANDLSELETMLTAQATTLDLIFNELARRAALNMGEYLNTTETYLRLALKAQSQCRTTLQTLAEIKNPPPVAFVKQANIANGPQQVNNGEQREDTCKTHARKNKKQPNKLLEEDDGEWLDCGTKVTTSKADTPLETLGEIDRPTKQRG